MPANILSHHNSAANAIGLEQVQEDQNESDIQIA